MVRIGLLIATIFLIFATASVQAQRSKNSITGSIFSDQNKNQQFDNEPILRGWFVKITDLVTEKISYAATDAQGHFSAEVALGQFKVEPILPNAYWLPSQQNTILNFTTLGNTEALNFAVQPLINCPALQVDLSANATTLRRCNENTYTVRYCNDGTQSAPNAYVDVRLSAFVSFKNASVSPNVMENGRVLRFYVGDIEMNQCGEIKLTTEVACDASELATSVCSEVQIFPNSECGAKTKGSSVDTKSGQRGSTRSNGGTKFGSKIIIEDEIIFVWNDPDNPTTRLSSKGTAIKNNTATLTTNADFLPSTNRFFGEIPKTREIPTVANQCNALQNTSNGKNSSGVNPATTNTAKIYATEHFSPNPMSEISTLLLPEKLPDGATFELYDAAGRLRRREVLTGSLFVLQRLDLSAGLYFYHISAAKTPLSTGKILVK